MKKNVQKMCLRIKFRNHKLLKSLYPNVHSGIISSQYLIYEVVGSCILPTQNTVTRRTGDLMKEK